MKIHYTCNVASAQSAGGRQQRYAWAIALGIHAALLIPLAFIGFSSHSPGAPQSISIAFEQPESVEKPIEKKKAEKPKATEIEDPTEKEGGKPPKAIEAVKTHRASNQGIKTVEQLLKGIKAEGLHSKARPVKGGRVAGPEAKNGSPNTGNPGGRIVQGDSGGGKADGAHPDMYSGKSTVSYRLPNRRAIGIPNPVYTCIRGGTVVVDIRVGRSGAVTYAAIDKSRSYTTDRCLWDAALAYAKRARFNADPKARSSQAGSITYQFQPNGSSPPSMPPEKSG